MQQNKRQRYLLAPGATMRQKDSIRLYKVLTSERFGLPRMAVRAAALEPKVCVRTPPAVGCLASGHVLVAWMERVLDWSPC